MITTRRRRWLSCASRHGADGSERARLDSGRAGFTLIEVMTALMIMAIALLAIALSQLTALRMASQSKQLSQAMYLAQQQMDAFYVTPPAAGGNFQDPNNPLDVDPNDDDLTTFNRSWTVQLNTPNAGMSTVTVQVIWTNPQAGGAAATPRNQTVTLQGIVGP